MPADLQADNDNHDAARNDRPDQLQSRLATFDRELKAQENAAKPGFGMDMASTYSKGYARASRIALELVVAILFGCAVGFGIDKMAHTTPLFILLGSLLGFAAGIMNAWRALNGTYGKVGFDQPAKDESKE